MWRSSPWIWTRCRLSPRTAVDLATRGSLAGTPPLPSVATLGVSSVGDVLALITNDGQLQLLGIHADGLRPQQTALPARVWNPDLTFNGAADAIYIAAGPAGLFELHRPTAGLDSPAPGAIQRHALPHLARAPQAIRN